MSEHERGQVASDAAEVYENFFVPALFAYWPRHVIEAAAIGRGNRVLDVACGTGILARETEPLVGSSGSVTGIDINEGMLRVARSKSKVINWVKAAAEVLPFGDNTFDRVVCQYGLMFFSDPTRALLEMKRVTRPSGRISVAVWGPLSETPGYAAVARLLKDLFGPGVAQSVETPYVLGDRNLVRTLFSLAGEHTINLKTIIGKARFNSLEEWIFTDIRGWTLANVIDDEQFTLLLHEAPAYLSGFVLDDGSVEFDAPAHIVTIEM